MKMILFFIGIVLMCAVASADTNTTEVKEFLANDTTDNHTFTKTYVCGHFARQLSENAFKHNISIGGILFGMNSKFNGNDNHASNYIIINGSIVVIEPQTDMMCKLDDVKYNWYKLYPNGDVPSRWAGDLKPDGRTY